MNLLQLFGRRGRWMATALAFTVIGGLSAPSAHAAANTLTSSSPAAGSTAATSPTSLALTFANPLGPTKRVEVVCNGQGISVGAAQLAGVNALTVPIPTPLPKGACVVAWSVSQPDGTPDGSGTFNFAISADTAAVVTVLAPAATTPSATATSLVSVTPGVSPAPAAVTTTSTDSGAPLGLARLITYLGLAALLGSLVLVAVAWPEGVEYVLTVRFLRTAWITATVGAVLWAICLTAQTTGKGIGASLLPTSWSHLTKSTPGLAALVRLAFTVACLWVVARPERVIDPANQLPAFALPTIAVVTLGFSRTGGDLAAVGVAAGVVHAVGMAVWLGGLILLARVVLAGPGDDDLVHAVRGFARISNPALVATVVSGAVQTFRLDRGHIIDTGHGRLMLLKALAVGAMVFVGLAARQFIKARLTRVEAMTAPLANRLRRAVGAEALAGVLVLAITAGLLSLQPGNIAAAPVSTQGLGPTLLISNPAVGADVEVRFSQLVGANAVRVDVLKAPPTGVAGLTITFTPPLDSGASAIVLSVPLTTTGSAFLPLESGLPLGAPGNWSVTASIGATAIGSKVVLVVDRSGLATAATTIAPGVTIATTVAPLASAVATTVAP